MREVVVGIDGSEQSYAALRWAAEEARCRSARLHIVHVYEPVKPTNASAAAAVVAAGVWPAPTSGDTVLSQARRQDAEDTAVAQQHAEGRVRQLVAAAKADLDGLEVERSAVADDHPSGALVRMSRDAELLVIGSRGLGGFVGLLLGSVGQQCVHHATCPVLIVRP